MEQVLTLVCKLKPTPEQVAQIEATLQAFAAACNYANEVVKSQTTSKTTIQNLVYQELRSKFGLSSNLVVRACARVGANRKTAKLKGKPVKAFKPTSADYDARIFAFREKDWTVSLTLMDGRHQIKLDLGQSDRAGKRFKCGHCGWHGDADLNGAMMIQKLGAAVNQPEGNELFCSLRAIESHR